MPCPFRHSICNELYQGRPFAQTCQSIRQAGYTGIEIAPFTLAVDAATIPPAERRKYASIIQSEGLEFVGLHWLMLGPQRLHVTAPDRALRERSWDYVRRLIDLCADFGPDGVMVFGSPKQRGATGGLGREEATRNFVDGLAGVAPHAVERGVTVLIEALSPDQTDVVTSLGEAVALVREIDSPAIRTMFDCHNAIAEPEPHAALVERHFDLIRHVHLNEMDGRHPGTGSYDFKPVLEVLARRGYGGWLSLEVFDFTPGADVIATESLHYMGAQIAQLT
ncbi:MAG: sugar phosphate isomerase/epimerase family protein [Bryobacteraceae bacterium]|jgi:sugar phosphate isomerase/epimerase